MRSARRSSVAHATERRRSRSTRHCCARKTSSAKRAARAASLSEPLTHLLDLLEALSFEPGDGVVLQQLRQREHETELLATSRGHLASAEWLKR